jgi:RHS repeat-associated protein
MTEAEVSGVDNPYRYSTKEWDEKSGLYYFGARYYSPEIGRWTQRDPAGTVDGVNLYLYASNDPVGSADTWGGETIKVSERESWGQWYNPKECLVTYTVGEFFGICPTCACYLECTSKRRDFYHSTYFREVPDPGETWIVPPGGSRVYEIRIVVKSQTKWVDVGSTMIDTPKELKFGPHTDLFHPWCRMKCVEWANSKKPGWRIKAREWGSKSPGETIPSP